ncbi:MAG: hypothetical protein Q9208_002803 [Pyrenodesmia sp. 3 TL-2023]
MPAPRVETLADVVAILIREAVEQALRDASFPDLVHGGDSSSPGSATECKALDPNGASLHRQLSQPGPAPAASSPQPGVAPPTLPTNKRKPTEASHSAAAGSSQSRVPARFGTTEGPLLKFEVIAIMRHGIYEPVGSIKRLNYQNRGKESSSRNFNWDGLHEVAPGAPGANLENCTIVDHQDISPVLSSQYQGAFIEATRQIDPAIIYQDLEHALRKRASRFQDDNSPSIPCRTTDPGQDFNTATEPQTAKQRQAIFEQNGTEASRDQASSSKHLSTHPAQNVRAWQPNPGADIDAAKIARALHETRTYLGRKVVGVDWDSMAPTDPSKCYQDQYRNLQGCLEQIWVQEKRQGRCPRLVKRGYYRGTLAGLVQAQLFHYDQWILDTTGNGARQ